MRIGIAVKLLARLASGFGEALIKAAPLCSERARLPAAPPAAAKHATSAATGGSLLVSDLRAKPLIQTFLRRALFGVAMLVGPSCVLMGQTNSASCIAEHYRVVPLPLRPAHINDARQVAGTTSGHRAALWSEQSGLRELPLPAGFYNSEGVDVNSSGHVTGVVYDRAFSQHQAFTFANDKLTLLPGEQSRSYGISDSDQVAGESLVSGTAIPGTTISGTTIPGKTITGPVSWTNNTIRSLGGCCGGSARSVNKNGDVIGDVYDTAGRYQAFLWNASRGIQPIGPPDGYSSAIAINAQGHVVVQAFPEVFLYAGRSLTRLDLSPRYPSQPRAINNCDVAVGSFGPFADAERAFIWEKSRGFRDLNTLIAPDSGWKLEAATSINDHGEIVGWGDHKGEDDTGFLLIPER